MPRADTEIHLKTWRSGPTQAERLAAGLLRLEGYLDVEPQVLSVLQLARRGAHTGPSWAALTPFPDQEAQLLSHFRDVAERAQLSVDRFIMHARAFWGRTMDDPQQFIEHQHGFEIWLTQPGRCGTGPSAAQRRPTPAEKAVRKRRGRPRAEGASHLSGSQAQRIHEAASFAVQVYGTPFNFRLTLHWRSSGPGDRLAAERSGGLMHGLGERLGTWSANDEQLHYVAVHERPDPESLRTTIVGHCPYKLTQRAEGWLGKRAGELEGLKAHEPRFSRSATMRNHWVLLEDLWNGVSCEAYTENGRLLADILGARHPRQAGHVHCRRYATSKSLGPGARAKAATDGLPVLSPFADRAWDRLFTGWELAEHMDRQREQARRAHDREQLEWLEPGYATDPAAYAAQVQLLQSWPESPHSRPRRWQVWPEARGG
jgi:hypothetical protein